MRININYIIWPLILTLIFIGVFIIVKSGTIFAGRIPVISWVLKEDKRVAEVKKTLLNPPEVIRAVYLTSTSGGNQKKVDWLIELAGKSELNAVVIDIKDFTGYIAYDSAVPSAEEYKTERIDLKDLDSLLKRLHDSNIYVIARMTVFQDSALVKARPDWAVMNKYTKKPWRDRNGLAWIDPSCQECWVYYADIAKDALSRGFDEINFDYIRFPSDGDMSALVYSAWDKDTTRPKVLNEFFKYMRSELGDAKMSADLFGFVTTRTEDFGVGQVMEDAFEYFDFISPMVYPSHYPPNFIGFPNPAAEPYKVIYYVLKSAGERLNVFKQKTGNTRPNIRPWLQDFKLGADYTQAMVEAEIKATQDSLGENYKGYMLWNARNVYHEGAIK